MRSIAKAVVATLLLAAWPATALAQDAPTPPNPKGPIPYTALAEKSAPSKAAARPRAQLAPAAGRPAAAPPPGVLVTVPPATPLTPSGARLAPGQPLTPAELEVFVDGVVKDAMDREHIAGVTVSVVQSGQLILKKGYGFADLDPQRPVDPDRTLFRIGSVSKTFTWIALMKEIEAGRIRIDAPVNLYLPERLQVRDQGYGSPVRVRHLMDHSAGFEDRALGHLFERRWERVRPLADYLRQERPRRVRPPGEVSSYSNYGVALAGEAVTYVSDRPFERLIEDQIIVPLRLSRTTFREPRPAREGLPAPMPAALAADVSDGYSWTPTGFRARPFEYVGQLAPAGSASSTAADMARYMAMLLNGGSLDGVTVFGPRTAQAFRTPLRRTPPGINGWAHGFIVYDLPGGHRGYGHDGATLSFRSKMVLAPALGLGIFVAANTETAGELTERLPAQIVQQFYLPPQTFPRPGSEALAASRDLFEGYYVTTRRANSGLESFVGLLRGGAEATVSSDGRLVITTSQGLDTWVPEGDPRNGRFIATTGAERLAFQMRDGRAQAIMPPSGAALFERASAWMQPGALAVLAALTAIAAIATLAGIAFRNRREFRETSIQSRASLVQNTQAALWLTAIGLFAIWASKTSDIAEVMFGWPGALLVIASACALVAAALTVLTLVSLLFVWRGGRRVDSWSPLRKAAFSVTALVYLAFSVTLFFWGALSPWSG